MSIDWNVVCNRCNEYLHLGQDMGGCCSFGYCNTDIEGRESVGEFISEHLDHNAYEGFLRIVRTDDIPAGCKNAEIG